jgi:hypothetical protein
LVTSHEILEVIVVSMRDAFLAVTVFVAAMVLLFSWLQYISAGRFVDTIRANTAWQPVIGALMGITPGCGGAIVMMPMYARGYVTYGTVIATLIATLGDAAFVLNRRSSYRSIIYCSCYRCTSYLFRCRNILGLSC